jgi:hypothetical protein
VGQLAFLALNPLHVRYSVLSLAEVPFVLLVLLGVWGMLAGLAPSGPRLRPLLFGGFALTAAGALRYEGWGVSGALFLFASLGCGDSLRDLLTFRSPRSAPLLGFLAVAAAFPLAWVLACELTTGDPLAFSALTQDHVRGYTHPEPWYVAAGWWWEVGLRVLGPAALLALVGGWRVRRAASRLLALTCLFLLAAFSVRLLRWAMTTQWRHLLTVVALAAPLAGAGLAGLGWRWPVRWRRLGLLLVLAWSLSSCGAYLTQGRHAGSGDARALGAWLQAHAGEERMLLDQVSYDGALVTLHGRLRPDQVLQVPPVMEERLDYAEDDLARDLAKPGLTFVAVRERGRLRALVDPAIRGWARVAQVGAWTVFRVKRTAPGG